MPQNGSRNYWDQASGVATEDSDATPASNTSSAPASRSHDSTELAVPPPQPSGVEPPVIPASAPAKVRPHVEWEAAEFVDHAKGPLWFAGFGLFGVVLMAVAIFLLKDWFVAVGFAVMLVAVGAFALRQPRKLTYAISDDGVHVGETLYPFSSFQSFSVQREGQFWMLSFLPTARFKPVLVVHFNEAMGEVIIDTVGAYLPMEERRPDMIDRLSAKIRF